MSRTIFDLPQDFNELEQSNQGMGEYWYLRKKPGRTLNATNFPDGDMHIKWSNSANQWWIPRKSRLRVRVKVTKADGTQLELVNDVAPNMNACASLFKQLSFKYNDVEICKTDYIPQTDTLQKRLVKSGVYLNSLEKQANYMHPRYEDRINDICSDGIEQYEEALKPGDAASTVAILGVRADNTAVAGNAQANHGVVAGVNTTFTSDLVVGDVIQVDNARFYVQAIANDTAVTVHPSPTLDIGATAVWKRIRKRNTRQKDDIELMWKPPLSIFDIDHAIPAGSFELTLSPQNETIYQDMFVESLLNNKTAGTDYKVEVQSVYLYVALAKGQRADNTTFYLDLNETQCVPIRLADTSANDQEFEREINTETYAITLALQDSRATSGNTLYSSSRFKLNGDSSDDVLKLESYRIQYAGQTKPNPDGEPAFATRKDYYLHEYYKSQLQSGSTEDSAGSETFYDWKQRGPYFHHFWPRDGTDRSKMVTLNAKFSDATVSNANLLLFYHYKKTVRVSIVEGVVRSVEK